MECDRIVHVDLNNRKRAFEHGFGFVGGRVVRADVDGFVDNVFVRNSFFVGAEEAFVNVSLAKIVKVVEVNNERKVK